MTRVELRRIGRVLNCGGEGSGVPGPCPLSVRSSYSKMTRTPSVKQKIREVEDGPVGYVLDKTHTEALQEIARVRKIHTEDLEHLQKVASGTREPTKQQESFWRAVEARSGRVVPAQEWARSIAIPQKQQYLASLDASEKVIKFFSKKVK